METTSNSGDDPVVARPVGGAKGRRRRGGSWRLGRSVPVVAALILGAVLPVAAVLSDSSPAGATDDLGTLLTLAGSGSQGHADGSAGSASFDTLRDLSATAGGRFVYVVDAASGGGRVDAIRKVDTHDGTVTTYVDASTAPALKDPRRIEVDEQGSVWVSVTISPSEKGILRFDAPDTAGTMVMSELCCGFYGTADVGDGFVVADRFLYYSHGGPPDGHGDRGHDLYRIELEKLPAHGEDGVALGGVGSITRSQIRDMEFGSDGRLYLAWNGQLTKAIEANQFETIDGSFDEHRIAFPKSSRTMYHLCFWDCPPAGSKRHVLVRRDDFGDSEETRIAGEWKADADGSPGFMGDSFGLDLSPHGQVAWIADAANLKIRKVKLPADPNRIDEAAEGTQDTSDDPVVVSTGSFRHTETDLTLPGSGPVLTRTYNSVDARAGVFGRGWTSMLDSNLDYSQADGSVVVRLANGQEVRFNEGAGGSWVGPSNRRLQLSLDPGSAPGAADDTWTMTQSDGSSQGFDADGHLVSLRSPGLPETDIAWSGGMPVTVSGPGGTITFTDDTAYSASGAAPGSDGLIDKAVTSTGLEVDYTYQTDATASFRIDEGSTGLVAVSKPHRVAQATGSYGWTTYELTNGFVSEVSVTTTAGSGAASSWPSHVIVTNTYDDRGRVSHQVTEDGDDVTFDYGMAPNPPAGLVAAPGFTTVTNGASGDQTVYQYNADGSSVGVTDALGHAKASVWAKDQSDTVTSRSGVATAYTFDSADRPVTQTETVGGSARTTATYTYVTAASSPSAKTDLRVATTTDAAGVTTTFTYTGAALQPDTVSVPCDSASLGAGLSCPLGGKATTTYTYFTGDKAGLVKDQVDPDGVKTSYTYHADRSLASTTVYEDDGTPRTTTVDTLYPGDSGWPFSDALIAEATRTESPTGAVSWEGRDAVGQVREQRDPLYNGTTYKATRATYRLDGEVTAVTDPADHSTTFDVRRPGDSGWSEASDIAEVRISTDPDGISSINKVDKSGDTVVSQTGKLSVPGELATTTNVYGPLGRLITSTGPTGVVTSYHYDVEGRVTGTTTGPDPDDAARTVSTEYDGRGQVVSETTPMGTDPDGTAVQRKVSYTYDSAGRKTSQLEGSGGPSGDQLLTGYVYDDAGRLWRTVEHRHSYTDTANPTVVHTADRVTETRYTVGGRTAQTLGPPVDVTSFDWSGADSAKSVTTFGYDDAGRQVTVTTPDDGVTTTAYDPDGRTASVTSPGGSVTSYEYDAAGRRTGVVTPSGLPSGPATVTALTGYDAAGHAVSETDPHTPVSGVADPSTRYTTYTPGGRVATVTDANGNTVSYGYDSRGNRTTRTATDDAGSPVVESWTWNKAGQELTHTVPPPRTGAASMTTTSTYDPDFGWLATVTDPTSRVQTHGYYGDGTLEQTTFTRSTDPAVVKKFWVNGRGWRTKSTSTTGTAAAKTWSSTYDRAGQKLTETSPQGTISHTYGLAGEQLTLGYPDGAATSSYLHDPAGRLTEVSVTSGGITVPYASYEYDDDGRQTSELILAAGGSAARSWDYDDAGRLTDFTEVVPNTTTTWETYTAELTYRADGRLATETVNSDPAVTYSYDDAGQLTSAADGAGGAPDRSWTYGTRGNRLTAVDDGTTTTYTTNPNASVAKTTQGTDTVTYAYDDAGRRASETRKTGTTTTGTTTITPTTEGYAGYIVIVNTGTQTKAETRAYDPDGKLILSDTGGGTTVTRHYQWDTTQPIPQIVEARNSGSIWFRSTWGNQRIAYKEGTAAPQWFQYDARGSVIRTDPANTDVVTGPTQYDPFGGYAGPTGADRIGYRGELTASNLIHLRARNYDPATGQFTSRDPLDGVDGRPGLANGYHYVENDPLNRIDPRGLRASDECGMSDSGPFYGACPSHIDFTGPKQPGGGKVVIHFFIKPAHDGFMGVELRGDGRDHNPNATWDENRVFIEYDFETGRGVATASPTCFYPAREKGDCRDAREWSDRFHGGKVGTNTNGIRVREDGKGGMKLSVVARDPVVRFAPAISACFKFSAPDDEGFIHFEADADKYPWTSVYRFAPWGGVDTLWEKDGSWGVLGLARPYCN